MQQSFVVDDLVVLELGATVNSVVNLADFHDFSASVRLYEVVTHGTLHSLTGRLITSTTAFQPR